MYDAQRIQSKILITRKAYRITGIRNRGVRSKYGMHTNRNKIRAKSELVIINSSVSLQRYPARPDRHFRAKTGLYK